MTPEEAKAWFAGDPDRVVKAPSNSKGRYWFFYRTANGQYKTVCKTTFSLRNKWVKRKWFLLKVFLHKLTHDTNYRPPKKFDGISISKKPE